MMAAPTAATTATMIAALVRKELRQLLPMILGLSSLLLWSTVDGFLLEPPDMMVWSRDSMFANAEQAAWAGWVVLALGLVMAYALLPGEHDQRTIEFLYTLPIRRGVLFLVKFLVGGGVLAALSVVAGPIWWLGLSLNPDSFAQAQIRADLLALELALSVAFSFMAVAYGLLLAYFRRLGWLLFALVWLALELLARAHPPLAMLSVQALFTFEHHGSRLLVPWGAWQLHAAMSALALAVAARLWLGGRDHAPSLLDRLRADVHLGLRRVLVGAGLVSAALAAGFAAFATLGGDRFGAEEAPDQARKPITLATQHFRFTYLPDREAQSLLVAREADRAYQRLQRWLPTPALDAIEADLTEDSREHQGIAGWKKLRLDLRGRRAAPELHHVLYHETAHVLAGNLAQGVSDQRQAGLRFFMEGLAEYLAYELVGRTEARADARRIAALARQLYRLRWDTLLDPEAFLARHDEYLLYPLGEIWVAALVDACGAAAPAGLLQAFADPAGPQDLTGARLWQHALQGIGCDLGRVVALDEQELLRLLPEAQRLPRASATFVRQDEDTLLFAIEVSAPTPGPWTVHVRARDNPDADPAHVVEASYRLATGAKHHLALRRPPLTGRRFEFQAGASVAEDGPALFTRWLTTTLR
jgi:hypothetical protein